MRWLTLARRQLSCRAVGKLLQAYLDRELRGVAALLVAEHLDDCRRCSPEADAYRGLLRSLARLGAPIEPERLARVRAFADKLAPTA